MSHVTAPVTRRQTRDAVTLSRSAKVPSPWSVPRRRPQEEKFWRHVQKDGPGGCWLWTAYVGAAGYGLYAVVEGIARAERFAHRIAFTLTKRRRIPKGRLLRHLCNNRLCVNPAHLRPGTHRQNMDDMRAKNRALKAARAAGATP